DLRAPRARARALRARVDHEHEGGRPLGRRRGGHQRGARRRGAQGGRGIASAPMRVLIKSPWGSDDPTKASFPFLHANPFAEAGHEVAIFLLGEAVSLMRKPVADAVVPVGWPPLRETLARTVELRIPLHV